jgi:hypothetical protein
MPYPGFASASIPRRRSTSSNQQRTRRPRPRPPSRGRLPLPGRHSDTTARVQAPCGGLQRGPAPLRCVESQNQAVGGPALQNPAQPGHVQMRCLQAARRAGLRRRLRRGPSKETEGPSLGRARMLTCGRWAGSGLASPSRAPRRTRNLVGWASGEDARSTDSPLRHLPTPPEPWSGLRPPEKETPTRKTGPPSGG